MATVTQSLDPRTPIHFKPPHLVAEGWFEESWGWAAHKAPSVSIRKFLQEIATHTCLPVPHTMHQIKCVKQSLGTPFLSAIPLPPCTTNSNLHILEVVVVVCLVGGGRGWGGGEQQSFSFDGLKKEKMLVPLTDWLMNNQISQHERWGGNLVARHAPSPWNSASLMWRPV